MIKALIFDCFGVFYPDPVFAYMRDPATPPQKAEALHALDEQAARGTLDKQAFVAQAAQLLNITEAESEQRFFHSDERNEQLISFVKELHNTYKVAMLSNIGGDMMNGFFTPEERQQLFELIHFKIQFFCKSYIPTLEVLAGIFDEVYRGNCRFSCYGKA